MRRLRGASLVEAIVAAVVFLLVFAAVLEILPRLTVRGDDTLLLVEADYRMKRAFAKYATGVWPCGEYGEYNRQNEMRRSSKRDATFGGLE